MNDDELAAVAAALTALLARDVTPECLPQASLERREGRWKLADRYPDLEIEAIRALH